MKYSDLDRPELAAKFGLPPGASWAAIAAKESEIAQAHLKQYNQMPQRHAVPTPEDVSND
jgi:hypothetical protein